MSDIEQHNHGQQYSPCALQNKAPKPPVEMLHLRIFLPGLFFVLLVTLLASCGSSQAVSFTDQEEPAPATLPTATLSPTLEPTTTPRPTSTPVPTPTPEPAAVRFAVIDDYGWADLGAHEEMVANLVKSWEPEFIVTTGDNNYPTGSASTIDKNIGQYYHDYMKHTGSAHGPEADINRFFPVLGNHDTDIDLGQPYFDYFDLPGNERYYMVDWYPVRIFAVNSVPWIEDDGVHADSVQAEWLRQSLADLQDTWNIVVFHHPPYGSGWKGESSWMRWPFKEWGAHAVLNGHNHVYERIMIDGFAYMTNGTGGRALYRWSDTIAEGSEVRFNANYGAQLVEATEDSIQFQFFTVDNELVDIYTIERAEQ